MKLNDLPARNGVLWVQRGVQTFFKQPLALVGMFFMMLAATTLVSMVPLVGPVVAMALIPAASLGLMVATQEAEKGKFPMPLRLLAAFRESADKGRAMWILGAMYAGACVMVFLISGLFDSAEFSKVVSGKETLNAEQLVQSGFLGSMLLRAVLYMPVSMLFWHAPALVHWHGVAPLQSLFYSWMACWRNLKAFTVYGLAWLGLLLASSLGLSFLLAAMGAVSAMLVVVPTLAMLVSALFFTSVYFSFKDCFDLSSESTT